MSPFFSIILPTYNRAYLLNDTIESVINQKFNNWELIIIDDGSTDNTRELVKEKQEKEKRIKYEFQKNSERSIARNNGIKISKGKYICFIDSDDIYEINHLESLHDEIEKQMYPKAMFFCNVSRIENGIKKKVDFESVKNYKNSIEYILLAKETVIPSRVCIQSNILAELNFNQDLNISEDSELFIRILCNYKLFQINNYGVVYKIHEKNTTNLSNNPYKGQLKSLRIIFKNKKAKKFISRKTKNKKLSICFFGIAKFHLIKDDKFKMRFYILRSLFLEPISKSSKYKIYLLLKGK